jgi:RNA polymerase sigma factor (TIGR02999 family)
MVIPEGPSVGSPDRAAIWPISPDSSLDDGRALEALVPLLYRELRAIAHRQLGASPGARRGGATLSTTALVNEAYLKLGGAPHRPWNDRPHFLATAAVAMRQILVDRARARAALKRGGGFAHVTLEEDALASDGEPEALLMLDQALDRLAALAPRLARVVELRFYGGLSEEEIGSVLDVTVRTVQRDWVKARMLLRRALDAE